MTPPVDVQTPQEKEDKPVGYRPDGCVISIRLLKLIEEEGEDVWYYSR